MMVESKSYKMVEKMKQIKQKKKIFVILLVMLLFGGLAGAMFWPHNSKGDNAQASQETETTSESAELPKTEPQQKPAIPAAPAPVVRPAVPVTDELAYTFEGTKLFIVAGSVVADKDGNLWQAKVKHVTAKGIEGPERLVYFKLQGKDVMTRLDDGSWRPVDDMDQSVYRRVTAIVGNH